MRLNFDTDNGVPYLDNAVTTSIHPDVLQKMLPFLQERFADPNEPYAPGESAAESLQEFRELIAEMTGAKPENVWFTSGGTEANNWVLRCGNPGGAIVCSTVEHLSVFKLADIHIEVDDDGIVSEKQLREILEQGDVGIVSIQHANQETGVVQDIEYLGELCKEFGVPLHVDASMSFGIIPVDLYDLGANFIMLSGHKAWGPVGAGALISDDRYPIEPFMVGGPQEFGMRAGPVNMIAVAGFAAAAEILRTSKDNWKQIKKIRDSIEMEIGDLYNMRINGSKENRLPNMTSMTFPGSDGAFLAAELERRYGMCVGIGGTAEDGTSSRVLEAMGVRRTDREATLRFRFSPWLDKNSIDQVVVGISSALREESNKPFI